jgi:hypothetical protein
MDISLAATPPFASVKPITLSELIGKDLSCWHLARTFVLFEYDQYGRYRVRIIACFGERIYADLYLQTHPDRPYLTIEEAVMLTDGVNGIVVSECQTVYVDPNAEMNFRDALQRY